MQRENGIIRAPGAYSVPAKRATRKSVLNLRHLPSKLP